jgi:hypothetical protein
LRFLSVEVVDGLLLEHRQQVDDVPGGRHVDVRLPGHRVAEIAEVHGSGRGQGHHEGGKGGIGILGHTQE